MTTTAIGPLYIDPRKYDRQYLTRADMLRFFQLCDAAWVHDGDPAKPHAEMISGLCSNGYFNCSEVLKYPNLTEILARQIVLHLRMKNVGKVDWVVGSAQASITLAYEVASIIGTPHALMDKDPVDPKKQVWQRSQIPEGSRVLQIEELITTLGTAREVRRAVQEGNQAEIEFLPIVGTIVHRPPKLPVDYGDITIISLIEQEVWAVPREDCPLCKAGSLRYRPKTHWRELTGKA